MATIANLSIDQGSYFESTVNVDDPYGGNVTLVGFTVRGQIRKTYTSSSKVDFEIIPSSPDAARGEVTIFLSSATTADMKPGRYVYDIEIVDDETNEVTRIVEGMLEVMPRVTR